MRRESSLSSAQLDAAIAECKERSAKLAVIQAEFAEVSKVLAEASTAQGVAADVMAEAAAKVAAAEVCYMPHTHIRHALLHLLLVLPPSHSSVARPLTYSILAILCAVSRLRSPSLQAMSRMQRCALTFCRAQIHQLS